MPQDEDVVNAVAGLLIFHRRTDIRGCHCGWAELGRSHAEHVAKELRNAGLLRKVQNAST